MSLFSESLVFDVIAILSILFFILYYYVTRNFKHWEELGIPYVKPVPFLGSLKDVTLQRKAIGFGLKEVYSQYKDRYVGVFLFDQPALVIRDLEIVKNVLVKDSHNFINRTVAFDEDLDPLGARNLFVMRGEKWKHMRVNLSPTFTSGKMKRMFHLVEKCANELEVYLDNVTNEKGAVLQIKDTAAKFTTDVIASCAFGIDSNSLKNPDSEFTRELRKLFDLSFSRSLALLVAFFAPKLFRVLRLHVVHPSLNEFLRKIVWSTVQYREKNGVTRNDFLDSMIELRKKGKEEDDKYINNNSTNKEANFKIDGDDFVAQAFSFLTAGFETSSTTMSFALYELALQPDIQTRLRQEIKDITAKHDQKVTYDAMQEMTYLDMVVSETLRKYPVLPVLERKSASDYDLPSASGEGTVTIKAGTGVNIPILGIHYDPEYYPEPERFDPERFTEENKQNRPNYTYLPFGEGPRFCIGMRFGLMQTKEGLIHILRKYEVTPCKETPVPLDYDPRNVLMASKSGIPLFVKKIKS